MDKVFAFHGGIHPSENEYQSAQRPIATATTDRQLQTICCGAPSIMDKVFAFHGGIHPSEDKYQSAQRPIATEPLTKMLQVPLRQLIASYKHPVVEHQF